MKKTVASITAAAFISTVLALGAAAPAQAQTSVTRADRNALASAKDYVRIENFSKKALYGQLHSPYGDAFSAAAAHYGANHVKANWDKEALGAAKEYEKLEHMSDAALYEQLTSSYGDQYTSAQARWAIKHL